MGIAGCDVVIEAPRVEDGGGVIATVPDLPGCMTDADTLEAATAGIADAIAAWIEEAEAVGRDVPMPKSRTA